MQNKSNNFNYNNQVKKSNELSVDFLINLLNNRVNLQINRLKFLIDSFPTLKLTFGLTYDNLLSALAIAYNKTPYVVNETDFRISISEDALKSYKQNIIKFLFDSGIDQNKKKKYIGFIQTSNQNVSITNENILVLTYFFGINLIVYNNMSQTTKLYYWSNYFDDDVPFIICKEMSDTNSPNKYFEIVFVKDTFMFNYSHPIITELMPTAFIVGLEHNKKLEYSSNTNPISQISNIDSCDIATNNTKPTIKLKLIKLSTLEFINNLFSTNFYDM
jgi:hypothetical protein